MSVVEECLISKPSKGSAGKTGLWRTYKPVIKENVCNACMLCWLYCPEGAISKRGEKVEIDYEYCKGCGICSSVCAKKAIEMVLEA
ncbi:MAG: ferredoxin [Archaeoglobus sp.]|nr:MAG: ferredoxin [Archaeoglobus sp.]